MSLSLIFSLVIDWPVLSFLNVAVPSIFVMRLIFVSKLNLYLFLFAGTVRFTVLPKPVFSVTVLPWEEVSPPASATVKSVPKSPLPLPLNISPRPLNNPLK